MTHYGWRGKNKAGQSQGLGILDEDAPPEHVDIANTAEAPPALFRCTVEGCGKTFKARHVSASHFRNKHKKLDGRGKKSANWKQYVEEI